MTNQQYTSLATSKLIASKMPSFETSSGGMFYTTQTIFWGGKELKGPTLLPGNIGSNEVGIASWDLMKITTALTIHDCLRLTAEWGKKEGWEDETSYYTGEIEMTETHFWQHRFIDTLISDNLDLSGKHVDAFFSELLKSS